MGREMEDVIQRMLGSHEEHDDDDDDDEDDDDEDDDDDDEHARPRVTCDTR